MIPSSFIANQITADIAFLPSNVGQRQRAVEMIKSDWTKCNVWCHFMFVDCNKIFYSEKTSRSTSIGILFSVFNAASILQYTCNLYDYMKEKKVKVVLNFVFLKIKWSVRIWQPNLTLLKIWLTPINRLIVFNKFIGSNSTYSRIQVGLSTLRSNVKIDRFGFSAHKILRFNGIHKKSLPTLTYHRLYIPWF